MVARHLHVCLVASLWLLMVAACGDGRLDLRGDDATGKPSNPFDPRDPKDPLDPLDPLDPDSSQNPDAANNTVEPCAPIERYFSEELWAKVAEPSCLNCHVQGGLAAHTQLVLTAPGRDADFLANNRAVFESLALERVEDRANESLLLVKASGGLNHGGNAVAPVGSTAYGILETFVGRILDPDACEPDDDDGPTYVEPEFFDGIEMISDRRLLRRVALSLVARLPTPAELARVDAEGLAAMEPIMDQMMTEDAFYERLTEGFNDILLTQGYDCVAERVLSYTHFRDTRSWFASWDFSHLPENERLQAGYTLADEYREAIRREPLEFIAYVVRNDRPFTDVVKGDYIVVSPHSSRGYGVFDEVKDKFNDVNNYLEYVPVRLRALTDDGQQVQPSDTGFYPHAGLLSMFHYTRRYPTTETNRNRLRARMYYQHFLGVDVMELAPAVNDAAAVDAQFDNPTLEAPDCVVCHKIIDPIAGIFREFDEEGYYAPRRDGWYTDMFGPGFEQDALPMADHWRSLQWLGERTAQDPRFAVAMVEHVNYLLTGRRPLNRVQDIDNPLFASHRRAYTEQRRMFDTVAQQFVASNFNLKVVFKAIVLTPFYRADGLAAAVDHPRRLAEIDELGLASLLTPEQLHRKLRALFGRTFGHLMGDFRILYGGIDSAGVTERLTAPSGAMGAIHRMLANELACKAVAEDFVKPRAERRLFPGVDSDLLPGTPAAEAELRAAIIHLHAHLLGREHEANDPEVDRTLRLFTDVLAEGRQGIASAQVPNSEAYFCRGEEPYYRTEDPLYTVRAWRATVTYLLRQYDFLYQ